MLQVLRVRDFRLLCGARLVSGLGSWLLVLAAPLQVLSTTDSPLATGLVVVAEHLPFLLLGPAAGVLVDRVDRRTLLVVTDLVRAGAVALLFAADAAPWTVHAAVLVESAAAVVARPAMQAQLPAVVGTGPDLSAANAVGTAIDGTVRLVGGPLGAALLLGAGFPVLVAVDLASYLVSAGAVAATRTRPRSGRGGAASFRAGLRVLRAHPVVAALVPATGVFVAANAGLSALLVPLGVERFGGPAALGAVLSALGVGFLAGAVPLRLLVDRVPIRPLLAGAQAATAVAFAGLVAAETPVVAVAAAVGIGAFGSVVLGVPRVVVQRTVPDAALGRVGAAFGVVEAAATVVGAGLGPVLAQVAGLVPAAWCAVLLAVAGAVTTAAVVPAASRTDPRPRVDPPDPLTRPS